MTWNGPPRKVLLLDDEPLVLRAVSRTLRSLGLEPIATSDPNEALEVARRDAPHVVISDLHMPAACGAQFLANVADVAPDALRVLISADPELEPKLGSLAQAKVHAILSKRRIANLGDLVLEQLRARIEAPTSATEREALARRVAGGLARPAHEDGAHRDRLARGAARVAAAMGLSAPEIEEARLGAFLHDVGQVAVPEHVFARGRPLTPEDRGALERHPAAGERIVSAMPALRAALPVIRAHHERQDGRGYPDGLDGAAIPPAVRAFQVADAYDALTQGRPYRRRRTHGEAIAELSREAGTHHDREAVDALASIGDAPLDADESFS
ncbi:MAG: response regulator [Labilithrix sp.]|nr:response regulator [Labilithrix sp.]